MKKDKPKTDKGTPTKGQPLIEEAYRRIKELIFLQRLVPGQRLVYDDLARMLKMSRTPIINALNRLEQQGLVVSESFKGFQVKPMDIQEAIDAFGIREALETYSVKQAIEHGTPEDFEKLEGKLVDYESYTPNYYERNKMLFDAKFHLQITEMTGNRILKWHLKTNLEHLYLRADLSNYNAERMNTAANEHRRLFDRMKIKDSLGSIEIIRLHIQNARDQVIACLSENELKNEVYEL